MSGNATLTAGRREQGRSSNPLRAGPGRRMRRTPEPALQTGEESPVTTELAPACDHPHRSDSVQLPAHRAPERHDNSLARCRPCRFRRTTFAVARPRLHPRRFRRPAAGPAGTLRRPFPGPPGARFVTGPGVPPHDRGAHRGRHRRPGCARAGSRARAGQLPGRPDRHRAGQAAPGAVRGRHLAVRAGAAARACPAGHADEHRQADESGTQAVDRSTCHARCQAGWP